MGENQTTIRRRKDATSMNAFRRIKEKIDAMPEGPKKVAALAVLGSLMITLLEACGVSNFVN